VRSDLWKNRGFAVECFTRVCVGDGFLL